MPLNPMKISGDQFLPRWVLRHILNIKDQGSFKIRFRQNVKTIKGLHQLWWYNYVQFCLELTNGGKHSSACLLSTENPPWVLVSEAVSVLQKEWIVHLSGSGRGGSGLVISPCCSKVFRNMSILNFSNSCNQVGEKSKKEYSRLVPVATWSEHKLHPCLLQPTTLR